MILVDSSVWVDYFRGKITRQTGKLDLLLGHEPEGQICHPGHGRQGEPVFQCNTAYLEGARTHETLPLSRKPQEIQSSPPVGA